MRGRPPHGSLLGDDFEFLGFQLAHNPTHLLLAWEIVRSMVDQFNVILENLATNASTVSYYNLRPVVLQGDLADWYDAELHPSRRAAKKIAAVFARDLPRPAVAARSAPARPPVARSAAAGVRPRSRKRR